MDGSQQVPWFPAWGLSLPNPIENVFSVVSVVNEWRTSNRWLLVSFDSIASEVHLWTAWYALRRNEDSEEMIANTPDTEFLRILSGTHQINRAFERAGISVGDERCWMIYLPEDDLGGGFGEFVIPSESYNQSSEEATKLIELLGATMLAKRPIPSIRGLERIGYNPSMELTVREMELGFLSHMALSDLR